MKKNKQYDKMMECEYILDPNDKINFDDFSPGLDKRKFALVKKYKKGSLHILKHQFTDEYKIESHSLKNIDDKGFDYEYHEKSKYGINDFTQGHFWWAFRFGYSSNMPTNDVPNISLINNDFGLDITINAETQASEKLLIKEIKANKFKFDNLINSHNNLWFKSYLKYQHFPYAFHWILQDFVPPGKFNADTIINSYESHRMNFNQERDNWIEFIIKSNTSLDGDQIEKLKKLL